jgi:hypothetical protein
LGGYFEPNKDLDEGMFYDGQEEYDDEDEEEENEADTNGKLNKNLKQAKQNALKNT